MTLYYVLGATMVAGAIVLSAIGLTRENFPPSLAVGRAIMGGALVLVLSGMAVLLLTTEKEHPREEAAEAAEHEQAAGGEGAGGGEPVRGEASRTIRALEDEFSIKLDPGPPRAAGSYTFDVVNQGNIDHDLEVQGEGVEEKTPLIGPGKTARVTADLKPGKYKLYCTVPGHEESGMKVDVSVR
jgi:plastocyanin